MRLIGDQAWGHQFSRWRMGWGTCKVRDSERRLWGAQGILGGGTGSWGAAGLAGSFVFLQKAQLCGPAIRQGAQSTCRQGHRVRSGEASKGFSPWVGKIPWRGERQPTAGFLPGGVHEQRIVALKPSKSWASLVVLVVKTQSASAGGHVRRGFDPWVGQIL